MMKIFDEVLEREVIVQQEITPEKGKQIQLEEPELFKELKESEQ